MKITLEFIRSLGLSLEELMSWVVRQAEQIVALVSERDALRAQVGQKNQEVAALEEKLEQTQRRAFRQAAPFRVSEERRNRRPRRPGRRRGHPGSCRSKPTRIDQHWKVLLEACPHCEGAVRGVRSHHPLQVSLAEGAAGVQLGPNALAIAVELNKVKGLSMRKTCALLQRLFGLKLTPGGLSQALARVAGRLESSYQELIQKLRAASVVHSDETSWWVGLDIGCGCSRMLPPRRMWSTPAVAGRSCTRFWGPTIRGCWSVIACPFMTRRPQCSTNATAITWWR